MAKRKKSVEANEPEAVIGETNIPKTIEDYDTEALNLVLTRFQLANSAHEQYAARWLKWQDHSRSFLRTSDNADLLDYRSRLFVPITENAIRALLSKYIVSLFTQKPFFDTKARTPDDEGKAERIKLILTYMFDVMPDFTINMISFVQEMLIYGTAFGKVYWRKKKSIVRGKVETTYEGSYIEPIHIEDMFFDPNAKRFNNCWKIHRAWKTVKDLKAINEAYKKANGGKEFYKNLDKLVNSSSISTDEGKQTVIASKSIQNVDSTTTEPIDEFKPLEILEYWHEDNSRVITVANRAIALRDVTNPNDSGEHPFFHAVFEPVPCEIYGRGVCEKLSPYQDAVNTLMNAIIDNTKFITNKMFWAVTGGVSGNQLTARPGKVFWIDSKDAFGEINITPIPEQVYRLLDRLIMKAEEIVGTNAMSTSIGQPVTKEQSATESAIANRLGNEYHGLNLILLEIPCLTEIVRKSYKLAQQYVKEAYAVRITGKTTWEHVSVADIAADVDIVPKVGVDVLSKEVVQQNLIQLLTVLANIPGFDTQKIADMYITNMGFYPETMHKEVPKIASGNPAVAPTVETPAPEASAIGQVPANLETQAGVQ